jgi:hypothetical protein
MNVRTVASELERQGFSLIPALIPSALLQQFEREIEQLARACAQRCGVEHDGDVGIIESFRNGGPYRTILYQLIQGLPALRRIGAYLDSHALMSQLLAHHEFTLPAASQSMRVDIPDEADFLLPNHQDYASMRSHRALRIWIPLRDANETAGTMAVFPGSHELGVLPHDAGDARYPAIAEEAFNADPHVVTAKAGDGVVFNLLLAHTSVANHSERIKFTLTFTIQDLAQLADPDDPGDLVGRYFHLHRERTRARAGS